MVKKKVVSKKPAKDDFLSMFNQEKKKSCCCCKLGPWLLLAGIVISAALAFASFFSNFLNKEIGIAFAVILVVLGIVAGFALMGITNKIKYIVAVLILGVSVTLLSTALMPLTAVSAMYSWLNWFGKILQFLVNTGTLFGIVLAPATLIVGIKAFIESLKEE
jgi:hypothetical protein